MNFLVFIFVAIVVSACSTDIVNCTDVNQSKIYQSLSVEYDGSTNKSSALASFRLGGSTGTTLEMVGNCSITHNVISLRKYSFLGISYSGEKSGFTAAHTFVFTDSNSRTYTNSTTLTAVDFTGTVPTTISRASGFTVMFSPAVADGETVKVILAPTSSQRVSGESTTAGVTTLTVEREDFTVSTFNGAAELWLERIKTFTPTEVTDESSGQFQASYRSTKQNVTITD